MHTGQTQEVTMPFGKWRGQPLSAIDAGYLDWLLRECTNLRPYLRAAVTAELESRMPKHRAAAVPWQTAISQARKEFARQFHPDLGGDVARMTTTNVVLDRVEQLLKSAT
jgi:hypothetical protein